MLLRVRRFVEAKCCQLRHFHWIRALAIDVWHSSDNIFNNGNGRDIEISRIAFHQMKQIRMNSKVLTFDEMISDSRLFKCKSKSITNGEQCWSETQ